MILSLESRPYNISFALRHLRVAQSIGCRLASPIWFYNFTHAKNYINGDGDTNSRVTIMASDKVSIKIPRDLYQKIEEKIAGTSFSSVEEYIIRKLENEFPAEPVYSKEEEELIRERLRRLGYIE